MNVPTRPLRQQQKRRYQYKLKSVFGLGVLVLAGCGGDGGGWDLSMSPPVAITKENAVEVAAAAYYSIGNAVGIGYDAMD